MIPILLKMADDELMMPWLQYMAKLNKMTMPLFSENYLNSKDFAGSKPYPSNLEKICNINVDMHLFPDVWTSIIQHTDIMMTSFGLTRGMAANRLEHIFRSMTPKSFYYKNGYKMCSLCEKEDQSKYGRAIVHVPHQCDGVTVCWKHGCALHMEDDELCSFTDIMIEQEIAIYAHKLYEKAFSTNCESTIMAIDTWLKAQNMTRVQLLNYAASLGYIDDEEIKTYISRFSNNDIPKVLFIRLFPLMFPTVSDFVKTVDVGQMPHETEEFALIDNRGAIGKYKCRMCGKPFYRHEFAVEAGLTCPACSNGYDHNEQMQRLLRRYKDGCYEFVDDTLNLIRHKSCGATFSVSSNFWSQSKTGCSGCKKRDLRYWQDIFADTEFYVKDVSPNERYPNKSVLTLTLEHKKCGKQFDTLGNSDYSNKKRTQNKFPVRCPYCDNMSVSAYLARLKKEREGLYRQSLTGIGATVIEYNGSADVRLRLDNGIELTTSWRTFTDIGTNKQEVRREYYIGSEWIFSDGSHCVISSYQSARNLTVKFDDGTIEKTTLYSLHREDREQVARENSAAIKKAWSKKKQPEDKQNAVGTYKVSTTGIGATVIEYKDRRNVLFRFDNGLEAWKGWSFFENLENNKRVRTPELFIGLEKIMKDGNHCVITGYEGRSHLTVRFDDGIEVISYLTSFRNATIQHP